MKICKYCGSEILDWMTLCHGCGMPLEEDAADETVNEGQTEETSLEEGEETALLKPRSEVKDDLSKFEDDAFLTEVLRPEVILSENEEDTKMPETEGEKEPDISDLSASDLLEEAETAEALQKEIAEFLNLEIEKEDTLLEENEPVLFEEDPEIIKEEARKEALQLEKEAESLFAEETKEVKEELQNEEPESEEPQNEEAESEEPEAEEEPSALAKEFESDAENTVILIKEEKMEDPADEICEKIEADVKEIEKEAEKEIEKERKEQSGKEDDDEEDDLFVETPVEQKKEKKKFLPFVIIGIVLLILLFLFVKNCGTKDPSEKTETEKQTEVLTETDTETIETETVVETETETPAETEEETEAETEPVAKEHTYQVVRANCTIEQALAAAKEAGGRLAAIHSKEEFDTILAAVAASDCADCDLFYLGSVRDEAVRKYVWEDEPDQDIAADDYWINQNHLWLEVNGMKEPSYVDESLPEVCMALYHYQGEWFFNDVCTDFMTSYPSASVIPHDGKIGYIIEIEE